MDKQTLRGLLVELPRRNDNRRNHTPKTISAEEVAQIVADLQEGMPKTRAAKKYHHSQHTIANIAFKAGIDTVNVIHQRSSRLLGEYNAAERLELINRAFAKASDLLEDVNTPKDLGAWAQALGVLIEKRRLEDGEATQRVGSDLADQARERVIRRLDELAARRGAQEAAS